MNDMHFVHIFNMLIVDKEFILGFVEVMVHLPASSLLPYVQKAYRIQDRNIVAIVEHIQQVFIFATCDFCLWCKKPAVCGDLKHKASDQAFRSNMFNIFIDQKRPKISHIAMIKICCVLLVSVH